MSAATHPQHAAIRPEWLALHQEPVLDPDQIIVDAHCHLYDRPGHRYLLSEMLADITGGHDVRATVYVQARAMYRADGPQRMRVVGETEFANGAAAMSASGAYGPTRVCAAIVGAAELRDPGVHEVLEAQLAAAPNRFRGIRQSASWDGDGSLLNPAYSVTEDMLESTQFREGFRLLARFGLSFDALLFFHQLPRLTALARAFPDTPIVLNHTGGILGIAAYATRKDEVFQVWRDGLRALAKCENVAIKLGGLGMRMCGFGLHDRERPSSSHEIALAWEPWILRCIDIFGPARCMFELNFPVDKCSYSYSVGLNAFKRIAASFGQDEKDDLFYRSAKAFYRIADLDISPAKHSQRPRGAVDRP
jgi:predicted TIM-barrel fold metal-dependent hydrolase